jgi:predicted  nucleic acid-binding Zn-ribbon protein
MARITIAQLQAQLEAERHNNDLLRTENESFRAEIDALSDKVIALNAVIDAASNKAQQYEVALTNANVQDMHRALTKPVAAPVRGKATVFEFDPSLPGDFARASKLAREHRGVVRRSI